MMNLWEKVKHGIQGGATVVADKASGLVEASSEFLQEKVGEGTNTQVGAIEVSQLQGEIEELRKTIKDQFTALGGELYVLYTTRQRDATVNENAIMDFMTSQIQKLEKLREDLEEKERALRELNEKYTAQSISMSELIGFKEDLESAGGAIEQLVVDEFSFWAGKTISELECRDDILIGLIIHDGTAIIPSGDSQVEAGDRVVVLGRKEAVVETLHRFKADTNELEFVHAIS